MCIHIYIYIYTYIYIHTYIPIDIYIYIWCRGASLVLLQTAARFSLETCFWSTKICCRCEEWPFYELWYEKSFVGLDEKCVVIGHKMVSIRKKRKMFSFGGLRPIRRLRIWIFRALTRVDSWFRGVDFPGSTGSFPECSDLEIFSLQALGVRTDRSQTNSSQTPRPWARSCVYIYIYIYIYRYIDI